MCPCTHMCAHTARLRKQTGDPPEQGFQLRSKLTWCHSGRGRFFHFLALTSGLSPVSPRAQLFRFPCHVQRHHQQRGKGKWVGGRQAGRHHLRHCCGGSHPPSSWPCHNKSREPVAGRRPTWQEASPPVTLCSSGSTSKHPCSCSGPQSQDRDCDFRRRGRVKEALGEQNSGTSSGLDLHC